ncbi:MAG: hypothetical protein AAB425_09815, partial [Bdellovibrionota bacterium]
MALIHGASLGISDDEAYYWVLSQRLNWGYAYHPPAVAWMIAGSRGILGWFAGDAAAVAIRFPSALILGLLSWGLLDWIQRRNHPDTIQVWPSLLLFSFWGFFGSAWMMVPDLPLFLAWMMVFLSTQTENRWGLFFGSLLAVQSKYSGVLIPLSSVFWLFFTGRTAGIPAVLAGLIVGVSPILWWNFQTGWESLEYQLRGRHSGNLSGVRWLRFVAIQALLTGPLFSFFCGQRIFRWFRALRGSGNWRSWLAGDEGLIATFALPPLFVFGIQPVFGDFKLHWVFVA